jgi:antitoxin MazE
MEGVIKKWGNSAAVRIPASVLEAARLELDQIVDVREERGRIVIEPKHRKEFALAELVGGITADNMHAAIDAGAPVGREAARLGAPDGEFGRVVLNCCTTISLKDDHEVTQPLGRAETASRAGGRGAAFQTAGCVDTVWQAGGQHCALSGRVEAQRPLAFARLADLRRQGF